MTSPTPALSVAEQPDGALMLAGELDVASAPVLATELFRQVDSGAQQIIIDAAGLRFCDSTGLGLFVEVNRALPGQRGLILRNTSNRVRRLLEITGLAQILTGRP